MVFGAGAAFAYWTFSGSGTGTVTTASPQGVAVHQDTAALTLAPGGHIALTGTITNPNTTDVKVGDLSAVVTSVTNGAAKGDFTITGGPVNLSAVIPGGGAPVAWQGLTLNYANSSTINQDNGKNATVSIAYSLTPFAENVIPPMGTFAVSNVGGLRTVTIRIDNIGGVPLVPGDALGASFTGSNPNGWACAGTRSLYCNLVAPAPVTVNFVTPPGNVNATLGVADANGVLYFSGPITVPVQWEINWQVTGHTWKIIGAL
jgi:hypothetical protein